jgi:hypothetical protein
MPVMAAGVAGPKRRRAWAIVLACVLAYEAYAFFIKEAGEAENIATASDWHLTGEVAGDAVLEQGLVPHADGFDGVDVWAHATQESSAGSASVPSGVVRFTITRSTANGALTVATVTYPAAEVVAKRPFHVAIPRLDVSAGQGFAIRIAAPDATAGHGLRFEASGPTYPQGVMTLGGRQEWGDLQFRTTAERTTIYRNLRHLRQSAQVPDAVRSDLFLAVMLLLFNIALVVLIYDVAFAHE